MARSSLIFSHTFFAIDLVLRPGVEEEHHDEGDQRTLRGHVEAEREAKDLNLIQRIHKKVDHKTEEGPQREHGPHKATGSSPVPVFALFHQSFLPKRAPTERPYQSKGRADFGLAVSPRMLKVKGLLTES